MDEQRQHRPDRRLDPVPLAAVAARLGVGPLTGEQRRRQRHRRLAVVPVGAPRRPLRRAAGRAHARRAVRRGGRRRRSGGVRRPTQKGAALLAPLGLPVLVVESPRAVLGALAALVYGEPAEGLTLDRSHRHAGQDDDHPAHQRAASQAAGRRTAVIGTMGTWIDGRPGEVGAHHAGGARPARAVRGDARARRRGVRDGGVEPRARDGPRRRGRLRPGGVHQPRARPPRLPPDRRGLLRREGRALHAGAGPPRPRQRRRRRGGAAGRAPSRSRRGRSRSTPRPTGAAHDVTATAGGSTFALDGPDGQRLHGSVGLAGRFQRRQRRRRDRRHRRSAGCDAEAAAEGIARRDARCPAGWSGSSPGRASP